MKRIATLLLVLFVSAAASAQRGSLHTEEEVLHERKRALEALLQTSPARFIEESVALAGAYDALATRHASEPASHGVRSEATAILARAASAARYKLKNPRQAIDLYRRAGAIHVRQYPQFGNLAYDEVIADIQQFDLNDRAAAVATLEVLQKFFATVPGAGTEMRELYVWKAKWIDAEIAWLSTGKPFDGTIDFVMMAGFIPQIYYGFGAANVNSVRRDDAAGPSHTTFVLDWMTASRLPGTNAVRTWLNRNDPGGFWTASMLTLAAVADRDFDPSDPSSSGFIIRLIRTDDGKPTALALLAREYAKTHKLPPPTKLKVGH